MPTPTYADLATLASSQAFIDRCAVAVATYARYILNENPGTQNHQRRYDWARGAILNARGVASTLAQTIALDGVFTSQNPLDFNATPDSGAGSVQVAVEATINSTVLQF